MFGRKKRMDNHRVAEIAKEQDTNLDNTAVLEPLEEINWLESEIIDDNMEELPAEVLEEITKTSEEEQTTPEEDAQLSAISQMVEEQPAEQPVEEEPELEDVEEEEVEEVEEEDAQDDQEDAAPAPEEEEEEVVYVVEGPEEDDEIVHPARLVKLPHLITFMLQKNPSKAMLAQIAIILVKVYNKYKDSPEDKKILKSCIARLYIEMQKR